MKKYFIYIALLLVVTNCNLKAKKTPTENLQEETKVEAIKKQNVQYMFFTRSSYANLKIKKVLKPNAALLIENKYEIDDAQVFFLSERDVYHSCGYHYEVLFWSDVDSLYSTICLSKECESFTYKPIESQKQLDHYAKLLETNPSHYIYNIEIPVAFMPEYIKKKLRDNGLIVFAFEHDSKRFPRLTFSYRNYRYVGKNSSNEQWEIAEQKNKAESKKLIMEIVYKIRTISKVKNIPEIDYYSYGQVGDDMAHRGTVELIFEDEEDLNLAMGILRQTKAEIDRTTVPETYTLQLIDTTDDIENIKCKLRQYKFIENVSKYLKK
jgi:hypothetical protein